ncbi:MULTISPECIES: hypothetical protein [Brucella/Ochrobactrum group]|uniref:hypothetical protein n=1 Tax=Brucella/Ochrobactrum group TaxID=2826938 RepID=UPI0009A18098|nr:MULTISPECIES: hypothetical protein [Brucella/Ochrobactrum group]MDH7790725.1 hypothetical protein [Ochrobactrum sp. AN78]
MATNDPHQPKRGRQLDIQVSHILRKRVSYDDLGLEGEVGVLPDRAVILNARVYVVTPFSAGTMEVGDENGAPDAFGAAIALGTVAITSFGSAAEAYRPIETVVTFTRSEEATAGEAIIVIEYAVDN